MWVYIGVLLKEHVGEVERTLDRKSEILDSQAGLATNSFVLLYADISLL